MTGRPLSWYWKAMWAVVSPLLIVSLFIFYLSDYILTGTLQYQAWDATQVPAVPRISPKHAEGGSRVGHHVVTSQSCVTGAQLRV